MLVEDSIWSLNWFLCTCICWEKNVRWLQWEDVMKLIKDAAYMLLRKKYRAVNDGNLSNLNKKKTYLIITT